MGEKQLFEQALSLPASLQPEGFGLSHLGKLGAPIAVIFGNFWYFAPDPAPEDRSYCCYIHWKLCVRIRCSRSSREALCISKVIHYIQFYFFFFFQTHIRPTSGIHNKSLQSRKLFCLMWHASKKTQTISAFFLLVGYK